MAELSSGKCFLVEAWSGTPEALLGLQGSHRAGLGSRAWQKVSEGCREGLGALLLGCEKWECFTHSITKDIICPLYSLLFQLVTSNVVVMSSTMHSFHVHMLYFWLLSSQLCKHSPHKSPQPTHLPLTQHSHNEKSELNEPSFSNSCTQPGPWNEPSQLFLLSSPAWNPAQCSGLPASTFSKSGEGKRQSIIWEKTWQSPMETLFFVHHRQKPVSCRAVVSGICTEHARSNVICPVAAAACSPCNSHSLAPPAPCLSCSWAGHWGLIPFPSMGCNAVWGSASLARFWLSSTLTGSCPREEKHWKAQRYKIKDISHL